MIQMLELVLLNSLFLTIRSTTVLPPQNLSMVWKNDFELQFFWEPPQHSMTNCIYEGIPKSRAEYSETPFSIGYEKTSCSYEWIMEGGFLHFSIKTICNGGESEPSVFEITYPELVMNLECYICADKKVYCSWFPASDATDLQFFYRLVNGSKETSTELHKCPSYNFTGDVKTGCNLEATSNHAILIMFNATLNNTLFNNTFRREPLFNVKAPPLNWTVTESKDTFNIRWSRPDMLNPSEWEFSINYTECNKSVELKSTDTSYQLIRVPHCKYCIRMRAMYIPIGGTPQSDPRCFGPVDEGFKPLLFVAIFTPMLIAFLVAVTYCCWMLKDSILPQVPKPRDLLSDYVDNNNVSSLHKLYIPAEEEENCCVTLIIDTQTNKPNC